MDKIEAIFEVLGIEYDSEKQKVCRELCEALVGDGFRTPAELMRELLMHDWS